MNSFTKTFDNTEIEKKFVENSGKTYTINSEDPITADLMAVVEIFANIPVSDLGIPEEETLLVPMEVKDFSTIQKIVCRYSQL